MNVAVDSRDDDRIFAGGGVAGHLRFDLFKGSLGRFRRHQKLRQVDTLLFESLPDDIEGRDDLALDDLQRIGIRQPLRGKLCRLLFEPLGDRSLQRGSIFSGCSGTGCRHRRL